MAKSKGTFVVPRNFDHEGKRFATKVNESIAQLKGEIGNPLDSAVTFRDLIDSGIAKRDIRIGSNGSIIGGGSSDIVIGDEEVLEIPPAPTGVSADGAFQNIVIEWDTPTFFGFSHAEVWAATTSNFANRVFIGQTTASVFSHQVGNGQTRYYWIRFVNTQDTVGPFNSTTGTQASTSPDIGALMQDLSETLQDLPGYSTLTTLIDNSVANIIRSTSSPSTRSDGSSIQSNDIWIDTDDNNQAYVRNASNNGWEKTRDSSLISLYNTLSSTVTTNSTNISTAQSDIVTLTTDTSANTTAITNLTSTVNSNTSAISTEATTRANADTALTNSINSLTSTVNGNTSSITTLNTTTANINGDLNAMYVLQVATESNGSVSAAGMVLGSNAQGGSGAQSYVQFQADKFAVWNGSSNTAPFIVSGGTVFIKDAMIQNGAITNAKIGSLAVDDAKIANLAVTEAKIANAAIATAKIQDAAVTNAKIENLAVTNAKINDLSATKITADQLDSARINVDTLNVKHFDNVSSDIKSHTGAFVPLLRYGSAIRGTGGNTTYTGSNAAFVPVTITQVRNNASYSVVLSAVLGDVSGGKVQYSLNNSTWVTASGGESNIYWSAGTYRGYVYTYQGQITNMTSSQSTVYWRVYFSGNYNHTHMQLHVTMDNTT